MWYKDLGYRDYQDYVDGPEWQEIKDYFYKYCGPYRCRVCQAHFRLLLHKRSYEYLTLKALKKRYIIRFFIVRYLKKYMVWLCFPCNDEVHFDDDGIKIDLSYSSLWKREQLIYRRQNAWYYKLLRLRPSSILTFLFARR